MFLNVTPARRRPTAVKILSQLNLSDVTAIQIVPAGRPGNSRRNRADGADGI